MLYTDYLEHYGVKGMKWGVRRYQNADGTLTPEGKFRKAAASQYRYVSKTNAIANEIYNTMSPKERKFIGGSSKKDSYVTDEDTQYIVKRFIKKVNNTPVAFLDLYSDRNNSVAVSIGTRGGEEYRHKGYAQDLINKAKAWYDESNILSEPISKMWWGAEPDNLASIRLSQKSGFSKNEEKSKDNQWYLGEYTRKKKV